MKSYTPGPWIHEATSEAQLIKSKQGYLIAEVAQDETYDYAADMREAEANAHLIASAPELLEALKEVEWSNGGFCPQCARGPVSGHAPKCVVGMAIAKAEGRQ